MDKVIPLINGAGILLIICLLVFIKTGKNIVDDMIGPQTKEKWSTLSLRAAFYSGGGGANSKTIKGCPRFCDRLLNCVRF